MPLYLFSIISLNEPIFDTTTGFPIAIVSHKAKPKVSPVDGKITVSAFEISFTISSTV